MSLMLRWDPSEDRWCISLKSETGASGVPGPGRFPATNPYSILRCVTRARQLAQSDTILPDGHGPVARAPRTKGMTMHRGLFQLSADEGMALKQTSEFGASLMADRSHGIHAGRSACRHKTGKSCRSNQCRGGG